MKNLIYIVAFLISTSSFLFGQQIANNSHISESRAFWNPAFTAVGNNMIVDGLYRMQWLGFNGAPVSGYISAQYPLVKYNMSAGAFLNYDQTGPVKKLGIQMNYAYKLKRILNRYDQFSLGISANFEQYSFSGSQEVFNHEGDPLIQNSRASNFFPAVGGGFFYITSTREYKENSFFIGAALNQAYTTKVLINDFNQTREKHVHLNIGGRVYSYNSFFEPMITANIVKPSIIDVLYSLKYEQQDAFWCGLGVSSSSMVAIQGGVILNEFGSSSGNLRMGALANYGIGSNLANTGPGFELYVAYQLSVK